MVSSSNELFKSKKNILSVVLDLDEISEIDFSFFYFNCVIVCRFNFFSARVKKGN